MPSIDRLTGTRSPADVTISLGSLSTLVVRASAATEYPGIAGKPFRRSEHHISKSSRDNPFCIMPGLAMITMG